MEPLSIVSKLSGFRRHFIRLSFLIVFISAVFLMYTNESSSKFPVGTIVTVQKGETLSDVAKDLKSHNIVRSAIVFQVLEILFGGENKLIAGDYYFSKPISTFSVAKRIMKGDFDLTYIRVTISEGLSMKQIAELLSPRLPHFSKTDFMKYFPWKEGYLFPDTYFFMPNATADDVIKMMAKNFDEKIKTVQSKIKAFGKSEKDVITMASILEKEVKTVEDWSLVSGILWKRLKIGMPLQVDCTQRLGSTYDTYNHKGLPPTPISNPGLKTIEGAVTPTTSAYFYYLSDKQGLIHYAKTFDEHLLNIQKYLKYE